MNPLGNFVSKPAACAFAALAAFAAPSLTQFNNGNNIFVQQRNGPSDLVLTSFNASGIFRLGPGDDFFYSDGDVNFNGNALDINVLAGPGNDIVGGDTDFCRYQGEEGNDFFQHRQLQHLCRRSWFGHLFRGMERSVCYDQSQFRFRAGRTRWY